MQKGKKACNRIQRLIEFVIFASLLTFLASGIYSGSLDDAKTMGMGGAQFPSAHFNPIRLSQGRGYFSFSFNHFDYYHITGLSDDNIDTYIHLRNGEFSIGLSKFGFDRFEEIKLNVYSGVGLLRQRLIFGFRGVFTDRSIKGFGRVDENLLSAELSIVPVPFLEAGARFSLFGIESAEDVCGALVSVHIGQIDFVFNLYRDVYTSGDARLGFQYNYCNKVTFESGFRVNSNEFFTGISISIGQLLVSVSVSDHPYLGGSSYIGVGWLRCLDSQ